jgi:hypothetical protein
MGNPAAGARLMATFPSIEPLERSYDLGSHPIATATFNNGDETRFLHGSLTVDVPVQLRFVAIGLTNARQISDHFASHGTVRPFTIPAHLWRMHSSQTDVVPAGTFWRYSGPPEETPRGGGLFDVSVSLLSVA